MGVMTQLFHLLKLKGGKKNEIELFITQQSCAAQILKEQSDGEWLQVWNKFTWKDFTHIIGVHPTAVQPLQFHSTKIKMVFRSM